MQKKLKILILNLPIPAFDTHYRKVNHTLFADYINALIIKERIAFLEMVGLPRFMVNDYHNQALVTEILKLQPDVVGFSSYVWNVERNMVISNALRANGIITVSGGPEVSEYRREILAGCFDYLFEGEGEYLLQELLSKISRGKQPLEQYLKNRVPVDFNGFMEDYYEHFLKQTPNSLVYLETERGCPYKCSYCAYGKSRDTLTSLNTESFKKIIKTVLKNPAVTEIYLLAPTFNRDRKKFREYLKYIIKYNDQQRVKLFAEARPELISEEEIVLLAKAGFRELEFGIQSLQATSLNQVKRSDKPFNLKEFTVKLLDQGITPLLDFIIGLPGDTVADILETIEYLDKAELLQYADFFHLQLLPGTELHQIFRQQGLIFEQDPPYLAQDTGQLNELEIKKLYYYLEQEKNISYQEDYFAYTEQQLFLIHREADFKSLNASPFYQTASLLKAGEIAYPRLLTLYEDFFKKHPDVFHHIYLYLPEKLPVKFLADLRKLLSHYPNYYDRFHTGINYTENNLFSKKIHLLIPFDSPLIENQAEELCDFLIFPNQLDNKQIKSFAQKMQKKYGAHTYVFKENKGMSREEIRDIPLLATEFK